LSVLAIREAARSDYPLLSAIEDDAGRRFQQIGMPLGAGVNVADRGDPPLAALIAGRPPVGFVWIERVCGRAHVEELAVVESAGRRGVGRALLEAACGWAEAAGYDTITLCTFAEVPWNGPFYRSAGFVELPSTGWCRELRAIRVAERTNGLDDLGRRVVMIRRLRPPHADGSMRPGGR
jgi:GNAT superfamily N-acetyltransferase